MTEEERQEILTTLSGLQREVARLMAVLIIDPKPEPEEHHNHSTMICRHCGTTISTCRCATADKILIHATCDDCFSRGMQ